MPSRATRLLAVSLLVVGPFAWAACKKEEPPPTPTASDDDEEPKPKKKKKTDDDEEMPEVGSPDEAAEGEAGAPKVGTVGTAKKTDAGSATNSADKSKLIACCTALRNAATAAGIANAAASNVVPGMPAPPPKEELDKAVKACDTAVVNWNGDLNDSLKNVKGATSVKLPSSCYL